MGKGLFPVGQRESLGRTLFCCGGLERKECGGGGTSLTGMHGFSLGVGGKHYCENRLVIKWWSCRQCDELL